MTSRSRPPVSAAAVALAFVAGTACAQDGAEPRINRPAAAQRLVRAFEFESGPTEIYDVPRYWGMAHDDVTTGRAGFPRHNRATLDSTAAASGQGSVRIDARSGSAALRLEAGVIPVFPGTEYLVSAQVRTMGLRAARAAISARYLDQASNPIPGAERRSERIVSEGEWIPVAVPLPDTAPSAAFLQIDLELLQPSQLEPAALGTHQVWPEDFPISAWFDDVAVVQLPRVRLHTNSSTNVVAAPERPRVQIAVRDFTGERLVARLTVQDARGAEVSSEQEPVTSGQFAWEWDPSLPGFGWYRATLELLAGETRVGAKSMDFAWVPDHQVAGQIEPDRARFVLMFGDVEPDRHAATHAMVRQSGAGAVSLPVWSEGLTAATMPQHVQALTPLLDALRRSEVEVNFALTGVPRELSTDTRAEIDRPDQVFAAKEDAWSPYLLPLIDKFGQRVQRWSVGALHAGSSDEASLEKLQQFLGRLVPGPTVACTTDASSPLSTPRAIYAVAPYEVSPSGLTDLAAAGHSTDRTLILATLPDAYSPHDTAIDAARRLVASWAGLSPSTDVRQRVGVSLPWTTDADANPEPSVEMPVLREAIHQLQGRRVVGQFRSAAGITSYILQPTPGSSRSGALVAWASSPAEKPSLHAYLGEGPIIVTDIFGNQQRFEATAEAQADGSLSPPLHRVPITDSPVYIENVDVPLAQFVANFALDPPTLTSTVSEHHVAVRLHNPWPCRIEGRLAVLEPGGLADGLDERDRSWSVRPRVSTFTIGPGETADIPLSLTCSMVEEAGEKPFVAEVELIAGRTYPPIRLHSALELAADTIELELSHRYAPRSDDLVVEAHITNKSATATTMEVSAFAPNFPRAKASVSELEPGGTVTRHFVFPGGRKLTGQQVTVSVQDTQTRGRITRSLDPS